MGIAIVQLALSVAYDYIEADVPAKMWFGRAMSKIQGLKRRREFSQTLVTDLTIGSVSGRKTGIRGIYTGRGAYRR